MLRQISNPIGMTVIVAALFALGASVGMPTDARADDCLIAPKTSAPEGGRWYYRTDRPTQRKCWYLRADQSGPTVRPVGDGRRGAGRIRDEVRDDVAA